MRLSLNFAAAALIALPALPAVAADALTSDGAKLAAASFPAGGALEARVDAGDDEVLSVHTMLRPHSSNVVLMRDRDGFWAPWSGDLDDLVPSAAKRDGDDLVYKIFQAPPPGVSMMTVTVAYRTKDGLKHGSFSALEQSE